jgi:hypothetical protein
MRNTLIALFVFALYANAPESAAQVAAPASNAPSSNSDAQTVSANAVATSPVQLDPQTLRDRWGFFVDLIDKPLMMHVNGASYDNARMTYSWEIPGEVLAEVVSFTDGKIAQKNHLEWDESTNSIKKMSPNNVIMHLTKMDDGSVSAESASQGRLDRTTYQSLTPGALQTTSFYNIGQGWVLETKIYMVAATDKLIANWKQMSSLYTQIYKVEKMTAENWATMQKSMTDEQFKAYLEQLGKSAEEYRVAKERKARARREFWGNVGQGLVAGTSAFSDATTQSQQREQQMLNSAQAGVREGERQYQLKTAAAQANTNTNSSTARTTMNEPSPAASAGTSTAATVKPSKESPKPDQVTLLQTPEAIVVCTHPNEKGRFECDTPVDVNLRGGPNPGDLWPTPNDFIRNRESCSAPRRLESTTHIVWGCGYGATNGGNTMDRSAGVDVRGRNTYFCAEREWPCRRTTR